MKLLRAAFENFRLLRDLKLDFSTDATKGLTVIRAENETGKTTILHALKWVFYGDDTLPGGRDFRLHPIDWDTSKGNRVRIYGEIEFETHGKRSDDTIRYRIIRSTEEIVNGDSWQRAQSTVKLFELRDVGATPREPPEAVIRAELPKDLQEVFFTDGDRALSFIEATAPAKRDRVKKAIRSLLGLGMLDSSIRHVTKAMSGIRQTAIKMGAGQELTDVLARLTEIDDEVAGLEQDTEDARSQFTQFDDELNAVQKKLDDALLKGDREKLQRELTQVQHDQARITQQRQEAALEHSRLFSSMFLARDLLAPVLGKSLGKLDDLHDRGKIPSTTIPVLEERLSATTCICGESIVADEPDGQRRRTHIQELIDGSRRADELQETVTELYYGSRVFQARHITPTDRWTVRYSRVAKRREELRDWQADQERRSKALEAQLEDVPEVDVAGWRDAKRRFTEQRDRFNARVARNETLLERLREERHREFRRSQNLADRQKKGALVRAQLTVTQDVHSVLTQAYERMRGEELRKVSDRMNGIFLEMIGSDPEQRAIIQSTTINEQFDIVVYGPDERTLDPDRDLNGASRRALTLAFILALTRVSEAEAPNVIDTPLGMMSGYVKKSVLRTAIRESAQLVLFLTRSELADCEEILDQKAGRVITLTNSTHYPRMLANDPNVFERSVLRCDCSHREECDVCKRRLHTATEGPAVGSMSGMSGEVA